MPVENVRVEWGYFSAEPKDREFVLTDDKGRYRIETSKVGRDFRIGFSKPGYAPHWGGQNHPRSVEQADRNINQTHCRDVCSIAIVRRVGEASGRDQGYSADGQRRVFHVVVLFPSFTDALSRICCAAISDANGEVTLSDLPAIGVANATDEAWLSLELQTGEDGNYTRAVPESAERDRRVYQMTLPVNREKGIVAARVVDQSTGKPITSFHVTRRYSPELNSIQSADGSFVLNDVVRRSTGHEIRVSALNYAVAVVKIAAKAANSTEVDTIELEPHPSFEGRLVTAESRKPIPNVMIVAGNGSKDGFRYVEWSDLDRYADGGTDSRT